MNQIEQKLLEIFSIVLEIDNQEEIKNIRRINEVKWDSLAHVSLLSAIENEFEILLDYDEKERLSSFKSTLLLLNEKFK